MRKKKVFLRIASNYPEDEIHKSARNLNIDKKDYCVDRLSYEEMPGAFHSADFSIIFYKRKLSAKGCSPIKVGESLACGIPIIINSGVGDCDRIIKENDVGVVIKNFSEYEYEKAFDKMSKILDNRDDTANRCKSVARKLFSLDEGVEKYKEIYTRLKD